MKEGQIYRVNNPISETHGKQCMIVRIFPATVKVYWPKDDQITQHVHIFETLLEPTDKWDLDPQPEPGSEK